MKIIIFVIIFIISIIFLLPEKSNKLNSDIRTKEEITDMICTKKAQEKASNYYFNIAPDSEKANEIYSTVYRNCMSNQENNIGQAF